MIATYLENVLAIHRFQTLVERFKFHYHYIALITFQVMELSFILTRKFYFVTVASTLAA